MRDTDKLIMKSNCIYIQGRCFHGALRVLTSPPIGIVPTKLLGK